MLSSEVPRFLGYVRKEDADARMAPAINYWGPNFPSKRNGSPRGTQKRNTRMEKLGEGTSPMLTRREFRILHLPRPFDGTLGGLHREYRADEGRAAPDCGGIATERLILRFAGACVPGALWMCSGVVPQPPPTIFAWRAISTAPVRRNDRRHPVATVLPPWTTGCPAFG